MSKHIQRICLQNVFEGGVKSFSHQQAEGRGGWVVRLEQLVFTYAWHCVEGGSCAHCVASVDKQPNKHIDIQLQIFSRSFDK